MCYNPPGGGDHHSKPAVGKQGDRGGSVSLWRVDPIAQAMLPPGADPFHRSRSPSSCSSATRGEGI